MIFSVNITKGIGVNFYSHDVLPEYMARNPVACTDASDSKRTVTAEPSLVKLAGTVVPQYVPIKGAETLLPSYMVTLSWLQFRKSSKSMCVMVSRVRTP